METAKNILKIAIKKEDDSFSFYKKASMKTDVFSSKYLFLKLANEEKKHKEILGKLLKDNLKDNDVLIKSKSNYIKISKELMLTPINEYNSLEEIFNLAIKKEKDAYSFYSDFAKKIKSKKIKELIIKLAKMELKHKVLLEKELKKALG